MIKKKIQTKKIQILSILLIILVIIFALTIRAYFIQRSQLVSRLYLAHINFQHNLESFASIDKSSFQYDNLENDEIYLECLSYISRATELSAIIKGTEFYTTNNPEEKLNYLLNTISKEMITNKKNIYEIFSNKENTILLFQLARDPENKEALIKLNDLIENKIAAI